MTLSGAVLAGGASRRMGTDKALLLVEGEPLWRRQDRVLRMAGAAPVILVRRSGQALPWGNEPAPEGIEVRRDQFENSGPLAGLHAALAPAAGAWTAILAVDMPGIESSWFRWLLGFCRPGMGAMARHAEAFEPLAAIYPREALPEIVARLERRELSLQGLAEALSAGGMLTILSLPEADRERVRSWNRPFPS